jgi:hypothetical protein
MAKLKETDVTLRVFGKTRDQEFAPIEITQLLNAEPTWSHAIGDLRQKTFDRTGEKIFWNFASWHLSIEKRVPGDLNGQILELLNLLPQDIDIWEYLSKHYHVDIFSGLWLEGGNSGETLESETLLKLGQRKIKLNMDIYADDVED